MVHVKGFILIVLVQIRFIKCKQFEVTVLVFAAIQKEISLVYQT